MTKPKKKLLPKEFEELLSGGDLTALKAVFNDCQLDARGGYSKKTALAFNESPDDLVHWLVAQGSDINAPDSYGDTPLHARSSHWKGNIAILLQLGADIERTNGQLETALHKAAKVGNADNVRLLLDHGARTDVRNSMGLTPLGAALLNCPNPKIAEIADVAEILLAESEKPVREKPTLLSRLFGAKKTTDDSEATSNKEAVLRIGTNFEFHRQAFNPESVEAVSTGLDKLYRLFDVAPVPRRLLHDGKSAISAKSPNWKDAHQELWELLVPSSGAASTIQGEMIRISGRLHDELYRNGGGNWDSDFRKMADALVVHLRSAEALPSESLTEASQITTALPSRADDTHLLCKLAVEWVERNPIPQPLSKPNHRR